ncbi:MAG: DNA primase [Candidatus Magasanikbacteria bacterium]|nr:DNA primase [Candidatus Magasanikbacteria bacterium]
MADTQAIKDRVDIVQLIQEYLPLKKAGANWKAPCPFHHEKTPSFMVHPEKQIWHCFGCGKGGDIFTFVQEMEGLDFPETLKLLADRAGVKIESSQYSEINKSQKNRIYEINSKAAYFFHHLLLEMSAAAVAREYLYKRRLLKEQTVIDWQIGFIPDQWDLLTQYLLKKGFGIDDLVASGLTVKNDERKSHYDRFRGRIMFPIQDVHGNIVGFTGRILVETENSGGKYVNTPQTLAYDKSRVIYGLNKAKQEIKTKDMAVLVEGQMDVIACHEAGMKNVIAASGTALTDDQVRLIKRYTNNIAMAFDADSAGQNAAKRGIDVALLAGLNIKVIKIPDGAGKDADECLKKNSNVWFRSVDEATGIMEWYFANILKGANLSDPKTKQKAAQALLSEVAKIPYAVEREAWVKKMSELLGADTAILLEELRKIKRETREPASANVQTAQSEKETILVGGQRIDLLRQKVCALIISRPAIFSALHAYIKPEYFVNTAYSPLYEMLEKQYNDNIRPSLGDFKLNNAAGENLADLLYMQSQKDYAELSDEDSEKEAVLILSEIDKMYKKSRRDELARELKTVQDLGDSARENELLKQIMDLTK